MSAANGNIHIASAWLGGCRFKAEGFSGHVVVMDADEANGGEGLGPSPLELLLSGLTGCIGIGVTKILRKMRQPLEALEIEADGVRADKLPHELTEVRLIFRAKGEIEADRIWRAVQLECEQYCPVALSLTAVLIPRVVLNGVELDPPSGSGSP